MKFSRRALLASLAAPAFSQSREPLLAPEWRRYADPATESEVLRLTDPEHECLLPRLPARALDRRGRSLLYASNRGGTFQAYLMDLKSGQSRQLGTRQALDTEAITLSYDDRAALLFDGPSLLSVQTGSARQQEVYRVRTDWSRSGALSTTEDGLALFFTEEKNGVTELRRLRMPKGGADTVTESRGRILCATPNPRRATVLWLDSAGDLWVAAFDGAGKRQLDTPPGRVLQALWSPDGRTILYLLESEDRTQLNAIREQELDARTDKLVAKTSQFAAFSRNADASVFLGASRNQASPTVLLLLRSTRREFTLCEHKAKDPALVSPIFTPNSQRIVFESDRHGQTALYTMNVEKLIEATDS